MAKRFRLFSWNVNGIRAVQKKGLLDWFTKESPDILCLQETKAMPEQLGKDLLEVPGYGVDFHWAEKKGYSGVATYAKREAKKIVRGTGIDKYDREGRVLVSEYPEFTLFNVYFPNGKAREERLRYKMSFYEDFLKLMAKTRKKGQKRIVVCGDVNTAHKEIDLARPKENRRISGFLPEECAWVDKFLDDGFVDSFRHFEDGGGHYTWWDMITRARERNVGWRIDYFFVSEALVPHLKDADIHAGVMGSDHCPIAIDLEF